MSSDKTPENSKKQDLTRSKQSRRKMLKSMAAGSGAVIAGKSVPDQWAKPMVDSVLLPVHARTSGPASCTVGGNVSGSFQHPSFNNNDDGGGGDNPGPTGFGDFAMPGAYVATNSTTPVRITVDPLFSVTPGVTDAFNLTTTFSDNSSAGAADLSQYVVPDPVNGSIAFNSMATNNGFSGDSELVTLTLTPDNTAFCGGAQVITISFGN